MDIVTHAIPGPVLRSERDRVRHRVVDLQQGHVGVRVRVLDTCRDRIV